MTISFDTNMLVYATADVRVIDRHRIATELVERAIRGRQGVLVVQALAEFYSVVTRKYGTPRRDAHRYIDRLRLVLPVHGVAVSDLDQAILDGLPQGLSFWDALLWATAERVGVRHLLTEDFQDGRTLGSVTFVNPFEPRNQPLIDRALPPIIH